MGEGCVREYGFWQSIPIPTLRGNLQSRPRRLCEECTPVANLHTIYGIIDALPVPEVQDTATEFLSRIALAEDLASENDPERLAALLAAGFEEELEELEELLEDR